MKKQTSTNIKSSVMDQIKSGKVHMRPRSYYTLLGLASAGAVLLASIAIAYLSSIVFFWFRILAADTMAYGARANLSELIASFPWWIVALALLFLMVAVLLVRKQGRMYKHKTSTIILAIVTCSLFLGLGMSFLNIGNSHTPNPFNRDGQGQGRGWRQNN